MPETYGISKTVTEGDQPWDFFGRNDAKTETPGVGDGQGGLACCDSWGNRESDTTEQLN